MDATTYQRLKPIFQELVELSPEEREAALVEVCAECPEDIPQVRRLLENDQEVGSVEEADLLDLDPSRCVPDPILADLEPGQVIGHYRLLDRMDEGGMGVVVQARDTSLDRVVAMKFLRADLNEHPEARERIRREARAAAGLRDARICTIYEMGEHEGRPYIVMAHYEGESLRERLRLGPLSVDAAVDIAAEVAAGLAAAHAQKVVHRDIKPSNIFLTREGEVKILDFGIARLLKEAKLTRTGGNPGTPGYMSPEQVEGEPVDRRADIWALGLVLFEMLTGRLPETADDRAESAEPEALAEYGVEAPAELERIIGRCLARRPRNRYQNVEVLRKDLVLARLRLTPGRRETDGLTLAERTGESVIRALMMIELVGRTSLVSGLGDRAASELLHRHDVLTRDILRRCGGREIEKAGAFLALFDRPAEAVRCSLEYQQALQELSADTEIALAGRVAVHLGDVFLLENSATDIEQGAKPIEVEGLARPLVAGLLDLAMPGQILMTRAAFDLARRASDGGFSTPGEINWLAHGPYSFEGIDEPIRVYEVGMEDLAPLTAPAESRQARRVVPPGEEAMLGWRPAPGLEVPLRANWRLENRLGEGSSGEAWLARHAESGVPRVFKFCYEADRLRSLRREVTLFRFLRQALGSRDDIATILDWNFDEAPYFLESEYSEGGDLPTWVEAHGGIGEIAIEQRLELVAQVADALAAAHSVAVLHKDVKPSNVLISEGSDGTPRIRLADFGIARLGDRSVLDERGIALTGMTELLEEGTSTGASGTEMYRAPELLEGQLPTVQADLFSLGVLLYQMVAGDLSRALASGWRRDISDELLESDIARLVDGRPDRRPAGAQEVADGLRNLAERRATLEAERAALEDAEQTRSALAAAHRRRRILGGVAAAAVILAVVVSLFSLQTLRARDEARTARDEALRQRALSIHFVAGLLDDMRQELESVGRLDIFVKIALQTLDRFGEIPASDLTNAEALVQAKALMALGEALSSQAVQDEALVAHERALELMTELNRREPRNTEFLVQLGAAQFYVGKVHNRLGNAAKTFEQYLAYLDSATRLVELEPQNPNWILEVSFAHNSLASELLDTESRPREALKHLQQAVQAREGLVARYPENDSYLANLTNSYSFTGSAYAASGQLAKARATFEHELSLHDQLFERNAENYMWIFRRALCFKNLGFVLEQQGEVALARDRYESGRQAIVRLLERDSTDAVKHRQLAIILGRLADLDRADGDLESASRRLREADALMADLLAEDASQPERWRQFAFTRRAMIAVALRDGRLEEAREIAERSLARMTEFCEGREGNIHLQRYLAVLHMARGRVYRRLGRETEAVRDFDEAHRILDPHIGPTENPSLLDPWVSSLLLLGRTEEARPILERLDAMGYARPNFVELRSTSQNGH